MSVIPVSIDSSQFPGQVKTDLLESLRRREINHKFHYDSVRQTERWLALHEAYSPARTDADCLTTYQIALAEIAALLKSPALDLISLGCGGGQKDAVLMRHLRKGAIECRYFPCDVAVAMALTAHRAISLEFPEIESRPAVCDLATCDLTGLLNAIAGSGRARLLAFFGMIPNFEPDQTLGKLATALNRGDYLILSANLAPGTDYHSGVERVLPLYDNDLTKEWLRTFLLELGVEQTDGIIDFQIESCPSGRDLRRLTAYFRFARKREISVYGEQFEFRAGDRIRLFFSYRYTPVKLAALLLQYGFKVLLSWTTPSQEEGIFLCAKENPN